MMRLYETHRIHVQDTQYASSTNGHVQGMAIGGTGYISGRTNSVHCTDLFANGWTYSLLDLTTTNLPIRIGDHLLIVCRRKQNGAWLVLSVANRTTHASYKLDPYMVLRFHWVAFLGGLLSILLFVGIIVAPLLLIQAINRRRAFQLVQNHGHL